jgi:adenylylsulfate kinase
MTKRILIMGLPGSGKTTLSQNLVKRLMLTHSVSWFNADSVREQFNDWDFSPEGRERQMKRMIELSNKCGSDFAICDFICPTKELQDAFNADIVVWMDTITEGRFADTNKMFESPINVDYHVLNWTDNWARFIADDLTQVTSDSNTRSLVKAASWRALGTLDTFILSWLITGEVKLAAAIGGSEIFTKMFLYWLHERGWNKIKWGKKR